MTIWDEHNLTEIVGEVLLSVPGLDRDDAMGRPFITSYQVAIQIQAEYPAVFRAIGKPVGGAGHGRGTLAVYLGQELARRIKRGGGLRWDHGNDHYELDGAWLSYDGLQSLTFGNHLGMTTATPHQANFDLGLFRLRRL